MMESRSNLTSGRTCTFNEGHRSGPAVGVFLVVLVLLHGGKRLSAADCNANGVEDGEEVNAGTTPDCNSNEIPDECDVVGGELTLLGARGYAILEGPNVVGAGDFDDDGDTDLVVASGASPRIALLLNRGDATFETAAEHADGIAASEVEVADLDGDEDLDVLSLDADGAGFSVLLNSGDGILGSFASFPAEQDVRALSVGDLDGDGAADVAALTASGVRVYRNNGAASFMAGQSLDWNVGRLADVRILDLEGHGFGDIVAIADCEPILGLAPADGGGAAFCTGGVISIFKNTGDGSFAAGETLLSGTNHLRSRVLGADLDGDDDLDVVAAGRIFWNEDGDLSTATPFFDEESSGNPVAAGDIDGDDDLDLIYTGVFDDVPEVALNEGGRLFSQPAASWIFAEIDAILSSDLDGLPGDELVLVTKGSTTLAVLREGLDEGIGLVPSLGGVEGAVDTVVGDLDGDADPDLAMLTVEDGLRVFLTDGAAAYTWAGDSVFPDGVAVSVGDLNGDGKQDLVTARAGDRGNLGIFINQGSGQFERAHLVTAPASPSDVGLGDVDGDGTLDVVTSHGGVTYASVFLNDGGGALQEPFRLDVGGATSAVALGDIDGSDGLDVAVAGERGVALFFNDGRGTFAERQDWGLPESFSVACGDLDGDRDLDLVATGASGTTVLWNDGGGELTASDPLAIGSNGSTGSIADLDGDLDADIIVANRENGSFSVLVNQGDGEFLQGLGFSTLGTHTALTLADADGDDLADVVVSAGRVLILANKTERPFSSDRNSNGVPDECETGFVRGDCDGDGEVAGVVTDAVYLLGYNFLGSEEPGCLAACDADGDGEVRGVVTDAVFLLTFNFLGGPRPPAPFPDCGLSSNDEEPLDCTEPSCTP